MPGVSVFSETQVGKQNVITNKYSEGIGHWLLKRYVVGIRKNRLPYKYFIYSFFLYCAFIIFLQISQGGEQHPFLFLFSP